MSIKSIFKIALNFCISGLVVLLSSCAAKFPDMQIASPDKNTVVGIFLENGKASYNLNYNGKSVLLNSQLGLELEGIDFSDGLKLLSISEINSVNEEYTLIHGKQKDHQYIANEKVFTFVNEEDQKIDITFRLSDNGVAFRYSIPKWTGSSAILNDEHTSFRFPETAKAWMQPMSDPKTGWERTNPSYEEEYSMNIAVGTPSPIASGWVYPALFQVDDTWVLISETGVKANNTGSRLAADSPGGNYKIAYPSDQEGIFEGEVLSKVGAEWEGPWRIIAVGNLKNIVESTLGTDLADPEKIKNTAFVIPGAASWSWALGKDDSIIEEVQRSYIDYASNMNWEYSLIDVNWDVNIGYDRIEELVKYAAEKNVGLWLWYNSAGDWNTAPYTPRNALLKSDDRKKEFKRISDMGIKGVKIDFFGGDGQSVMKYYHDILSDAAEAKLMVNFHGSTLPRGWHRTYPNLMTAEAVKGFEMISFDQAFADRAPRHMTMLPFTRNVYDPMDFTPMVLDSIPDIERRSTHAFELALSILYYSGVQHFAESPEGMQKQPREVINFLQNLPSSWEEIKFIEGYPGEYVVLARRSGSEWYLAGINGSDQEKLLNIDLTPFQKNGNTLKIIQDSPDNQVFEIQNLSTSSTVDVKVGSHSGFIIHINNND